MLRTTCFCLPFLFVYFPDARALLVQRGLFHHAINRRRPLTHFVAASSDEMESLQKNITTESSSALVMSVTTLQEQANALRAEAESLQKAIEEEKKQKLQKEEEKVDRWINDLLVNFKIDESTDILNTVEEVMQRLQDGRYSKEHVDKIFDRLCETGPPQSRSNCSPLMRLLVDGAGKMDDIEREDNPNKRWSGRVEQQLQKRLFALDYGIKLEKDDDDDLKTRRSLI